LYLFVFYFVINFSIFYQNTNNDITTGNMVVYFIIYLMQHIYIIYHQIY